MYTKTTHPHQSIMNKVRESFRKKHRPSVLVRKLFLTEHKLRVFESEVKKYTPNKIILWLFWLLSPFGVHRFYLQHYFMGFMMLITLGGFGVWAALDFFFLPDAYIKRVEDIENQVLNSLNEADYV